MQRPRVIVVMPAYNAAKTIERTHKETVDLEIVDRIVVVDDGSMDETAVIANGLRNTILHRHESNLGYGGNQKTCYRLALELGGDIVVMLHPDYQYTPRLIPSLAALISSGHYDVALGSRILGGGALRGGMPWWRYVANRGLTFVQNLMTGAKLSEYHTGYRAFSREVLEAVPFEKNSNDFLFDNQILMQVIERNFRIGEVSCPTRYFPEASSIGFGSCVAYGTGCLKEALRYFIKCRLCIGWR